MGDIARNVYVRRGVCEKGILWAGLPNQVLTLSESIAESSGPAVDSFQSFSPTLNQGGAGQGGDTG